MDSLKIDYRALPRPYITTNSLECLRRKCPYFGNGCFVFGARRLAEASNIVVTNHSLLFCDVCLLYTSSGAVRGGAPCSDSPGLGLKASLLPSCGTARGPLPGLRRSPVHLSAYGPF